MRNPALVSGAGYKQSVAFLILLLSVPLALAVGAVPIAVDRLIPALTGTGQEHTIVVNIRLPRVLTAVLVGAGLAAAGMAFQAIFRNPLAEPYILGISSGAALGAVLAIAIGASFGAALASLPLLPLAAFAGALVVAGLAFIIAGQRSAWDTNVLLLSGLSLSFLADGILSTILLMNRDYLQKIYFWSLGSFADSSWDGLALSSVIMILGMLVLLVYSRELDLLTMGRDAALSMGVHVSRDQFVILCTACLIASTAVATSGIIAFVGLVAPQLARLLVGTAHRRVQPMAMTIGAVLMLWADVLARSLIPPRELPLSIFTACIGVPFFIFLLRKRGVFRS